jgi:hypothetical protein
MVTLLHKPDPRESIRFLSFTVDRSKKDKAKVLGNITLFDAMRYLAIQQNLIGEKRDAKKTLDQMVSMLSKDIKNEIVLKYIKAQANRTLELDISKATANIFRHE